MKAIRYQPESFEYPTQTKILSEFLDPYQKDSKFNQLEKSIEELGKNIEELKTETNEIKNKIDGYQIGGNSSYQNLKDSIKESIKELNYDYQIGGNSSNNYQIEIQNLKDSMNLQNEEMVKKIKEIELLINPKCFFPESTKEIKINNYIPPGDIPSNKKYKAIISKP